MAPDHGEDDFALCKAHGIEPKFAVTADGKYREDWGWLGGQGSVINPKFNAPDGPICSALAGGRADGGERRLQALLPAFVALEGQGDLPLHAPVVRADGSGPRGRHLREKAVAAIAATRFVPEKGRNRIGAMVEGRPTGCSRASAPGACRSPCSSTARPASISPIPKSTPASSRACGRGVDAWDDERAGLSGRGLQADDYERVTDILDVWFDSGSTHAFVLDRAAGPSCAGRPISISKARTSIAAGSSPRC
jgi:isoleucyl-tRNA synthetase